MKQAAKFLHKEISQVTEPEQLAYGHRNHRSKKAQRKGHAWRKSVKKTFFKKMEIINEKYV